MNMKIAFLALALVGCGSGALAASATGNASVQIVLPLTISQSQQLSFGTVIKPTTGSGTVVMAPDGSISTTGNGTDTVGSHTAALFTLHGEPNQNVTIALPASTLMANSASDTVSVSLTNNAVGNVVSLGPSGVGSLGVGGTMSLNATSPSGAYTGTFNVTANYQ